MHPVVQSLNEALRIGYLLHGSPHLHINTLQPRRKISDQPGSAVVYAADNLLVPLSCAIFARRCNDETCTNKHQDDFFVSTIGIGCIYILERHGFVQNGNEYHSFLPVPIITKYIVSPLILGEIDLSRITR